MSDPHFPSRRRKAADATPGPPPAAEAAGAPSDPELPSDAELVVLPLSAAREDPAAPPPDRLGSTTRSKLAEGARGIKLALRAESSYFAHAYRGLLIAISAAILGVSAAGWCFLIVAAALVLVAETFRCALCAALDALDEPDDPRFRAAREIAAGGLLFASLTSAALTITVLGARLGEVLGW